MSELLVLVEPDARLPVLTSRFDAVEQLVDAGYFASAFDITSVEADYKSFIAAYRRLTDRQLVGRDAFIARSLLVHDLRRIRLRAPDVPAALLPDPWIGNDAMDLAGHLYANLSTAAAPFLSTTLQLAYPATFPHRFT